MKIKLYLIVKRCYYSWLACVFSVKNLDPEVRTWEQDMLEKFYEQYELNE